MGWLRAWLARSGKGAIGGIPRAEEHSYLAQLASRYRLGHHRDPVKSRGYFEEGVRRWPEYYDFYEVYVSRLVPKWGGSWGAVDQFISSWSVKRLSSEGDSMYARLYTNLISAELRPTSHALFKNSLST